MRRQHNVSALPSWPPDAGAYPLFARATAAVCVLEPGDALYIPRRWWHWVTSYERNVALNFWHDADLATAHVAADEQPLAEVTTIAATEGFRNTWFAAKRPVVVRDGGIAAWPAFTAWTDEYLLDRAGAARFGVGLSPDPQLSPVQGAHRTRVEVMTLPAFLTRAASGDQYCYLAQDERLPAALAGDWHVPEFWRRCFDDDRFRVPLWFTFGGAGGVTSALHFDYYENLLVQVHGRKRVLLFSPSETPYLYRTTAEPLRPLTA